MKKILLILTFSFAFLQAKTLEAFLSADNPIIGEICTLSIKFPENIRPISIINPQEWVGSVRFRDVREVLVYDSQNSKIQILLSFYEAPVCTIAPLRFLVQNAEGEADTLETEPIIVNVVSVLAGLDSAQIERLSRYGQVNPMRAGSVPLGQILFILAIIVLCILFAIWMTKRFLKGRNTAEIIVPPFEEAMDAFVKLDEAEHINKGEYKTFVYELSFILKRYVSRRYEVNIEEATSTEFKQWLRKASEISKENRRLVENFINETDPVKFADITPSIEVLRKLRAETELFVKNTRPIENLTVNPDNLVKTEEKKI